MRRKASHPRGYFSTAFRGLRFLERVGKIGIRLFLLIVIINFGRILRMVEPEDDDEEDSIP